MAADGSNITFPFRVTGNSCISGFLWFVVRWEPVISYNEKVKKTEFINNEPVEGKDSALRREISLIPNYVFNDMLLR